MSSPERTNEGIVPPNVIDAYLEQYKKDPKTLDAIETLYQQTRVESFSRMTAAPTPGTSLFVLVAGTQGVGKSKMVEDLLKNRTEQFVVCDVDSILSRMQAVKTAIGDAEHDLMRDHYDLVAYTPENHRAKADAAVEYFRNGAKSISDRIMNEAVKAGYNVLVETNAKTKHIGAFLDAIKDSGVRLEGHICDAPLRIKMLGATSAQHGFSLPKDVLAAEHAAFRENMPVIAKACSGSLTLWWRHDALEGLAPAAIATAKSYETFPVGKAGFESHFADLDGRTINSLMGLRKDVSPKHDLQRTFTRPVYGLQMAS